MKRNWFCLVLPAVLLAIPFGNSGAAADEEIEIPLASSVLSARYSTDASGGTFRGQGWVWDDDMPMGGSFLMRHLTGQDWPVVCASIAACSPAATALVNVSSVLGSCQSPAEFACIERLSLTTDLLLKEDLALVSGGETVFPEDAQTGVPRGTHTSVWQASDGSRFAVVPTFSTSLSAVKGRWPLATSGTFQVNIYRVRSNLELSKSVVKIIDRLDSPGKWGYTCEGGCKPGTVLEPAPGTRYELVVRLPNTVSGWFQGRVADATIGAVPIDTGRTRYTISARPARVLVAGAVASIDDPKFPGQRNSINTVRLQVSKTNPFIIDDYQRWAPFMGDKALMRRTEWSLGSFNSYSTSGKSCFDGSKGLVGVAATNAGFYSPTPPTINATTGMFEYVVASPHHDENGNVASGTYTLGVPQAVLNCLYGTTATPSVAEVSLVYKDGSPYTVTQNVTVTDGWVNVSVEGFHFSKPKVQVKFLARDAHGRVIALPSAVRKGRISRGTRFATSVLANPTARTKPKWSVAGACRLRSGTVIATRKGTCTVTLLAMKSGRHTVVLRKNIKVV